MPKVKEGVGPAVERVKRSVRSVFGRQTRSDSPWFNHPEMQARIAKAEDDLANGRYTDTPAGEYLERLRKSV